MIAWSRPLTAISIATPRTTSAPKFSTSTKKDLSQKASCVRLIFDKVWQPWNTQKYKKLAPSLCPHCEVEDSLGHLLRDCTEPAILNLRKAALDSVRLIASEGNETNHAVFDAMLEVINEPDGATIWRSLWLPAQIESFRIKLHQANQISLDPSSLKYDHQRSREIHAAVLDFANVFGLASLNMMRERNAKTQDALRPLRKQQAGKILPPPLALYLKQKKFTKKGKTKKPPVLPDNNSRVKSMFPIFVPAPRVHPRVLAQAYNRDRELDAEARADAARLVNGEVAAIVYEEPIIAEPAIEVPWGPHVLPHEADVDVQHLAGPQWWDYRNRSMTNQLRRAGMYEDIIFRREADAQAIRDAEDLRVLRNDPAHIAALRSQSIRRIRFTRESVAASERWSDHCRAIADRSPATGDIPLPLAQPAGATSPEDTRIDINSPNRTHLAGPVLNSLCPTDLARPTVISLCSRDVPGTEYNNQQTFPSLRATISASHSDLADPKPTSPSPSDLAEPDHNSPNLSTSPTPNHNLYLLPSRPEYNNHQPWAPVRAPRPGPNIVTTTSTSPRDLADPEPTSPSFSDLVDPDYNSPNSSTSSTPNHSLLPARNTQTASPRDSTAPTTTAEAEPNSLLRPEADLAARVALRITDRESVRSSPLLRISTRSPDTLPRCAEEDRSNTTSPTAVPSFAPSHEGTFPTLTDHG